jgi:DnaA-homolog protein
MQQLPLGVRLHDRAVFGSFVTGDSPLALAAAQALARGEGDGLLYLHGPTGSGRSHLLQALCAAVPGAGYFPLRQLQSLGADVFEGAASLPLVTLDDLDAVVGDAAWERRLFQLYNECLAQGVRLAAAAGAPATLLGIVLPDLASRLAALPHFALRPLDETQQREALRLRAQLRGLELPDETLIYLQRRFARDMASLHGLLDRLDLASLQEQRRVTVPFIREVLEKDR